MSNGGMGLPPGLMQQLMAQSFNQQQPGTNFKQQEPTPPGRRSGVPARVKKGRRKKK